ncbi:hypothetical protein CSV72_09905 [Sporosarcina sp. P20a]|uniref:hypothetical protein n=1 Tax=Sporosarcina sp. P20a TaxID=2048256 RepID=UPI000C163581|nr:hypothetical protein [Sporosarcina sp. P20a]PIC86121.1 hypothetical protein CSV72_09905 [Sporosarcina sp. P20a]
MKKKLFILLSVVIALIIVSGSYLLYIFQFKEYDVADDQIDNILEDPYDVVLPKGTKLVMDQTEGKLSKVHPVLEEEDWEGGQSDEGTTSSSDDDTELLSVTLSGDNADHSSIDRPSSISTWQDDEVSNDDANSQKSTVKATVAEIKKKYEPVFTNFHEQVDDKHNSVIDRVKDEYSIKKEAEKSFSYAYMYSKYMGVADTFEAKTDFMFNGIIESLEKDLEANGYSNAYSKSFRDEYEKGKKVRRDEIFNEAMGR